MRVTAYRAGGEVIAGVARGNCATLYRNEVVCGFKTLADHDAARRYILEWIEKEANV